MIYKFLRWYTKWGIKFYYKNIFIYHKSPIDFNKPIIFSSNHPAGFYESIILTTLLKKPVIFLVRSDYVNIKGLKWFFNIVKLYPIYRSSEGFKDVNKNKGVFSILNNKLKENCQICIYPEGTTKFKYHLNPIKKGISRLIVGAVNDGVENLNLVPIGFNFTAPAQFRSYLFVYSKSSIEMNKAIDFDENDRSKVKQLTEDIRNDMKSTVLHFENKERQELYKEIQLIYINNKLKNKKYKPYENNTNLPEKIKNLSIYIDNLDKDKFDDLKNKTNKYLSKLKEFNINDKSVISKRCSIFDKLKLFVYAPVFIIGLILNLLPVLITLYVRKTWIKQYEYKAVVTVLLSQILYGMYFVTILGFSIYFYSYWGLIVFIFPIIAWFSLKYYDFYNDCKNKYRFNKVVDKNNLIKLRNEIADVINPS